MFFGFKLSNLILKLDLGQTGQLGRQLNLIHNLLRTLNVIKIMSQTTKTLKKPILSLCHYISMSFHFHLFKKTISIYTEII